VIADRNPYLILGVDFAASREDARRHFALAARRARREGGRWQREDLTWALHEVENLEARPEDTVDIFRVPADPSAFEPAGEGLYKPAPVPLARRTAQTGEAELTPICLAGARELVEAVIDAVVPDLEVSGLTYTLGQESS
jgi:hypothetical protein